MTPELVNAIFDGLGRYTAVLVPALIVVIPLFLKLRETGLTVAKIEATTASTAAVNRAQDVKLSEVIDLANGRLEQALKLVAEVRAEYAYLSGSPIAQKKAVEAQQVHDDHKAYADAARAVVEDATAATVAQTVVIEAVTKVDPLL